MNPKVAHRSEAPDVGFMTHSEQVIGVEFNGLPVAISLRILWYHEVINLINPGERLVVTYSPLTGAARAFDPTGVAGDTLRVSNYVLGSGLVMEDGSGTLYPQLTAATCGPQDGAQLKVVPYEMMAFGAWLQIFPDTWIVSRNTGYDFLYTLYPYGNRYTVTSNPFTQYPLAAPIDRRLLPKQVVIGVPHGKGGVAFPVDRFRGLAQEEHGDDQQVLVWAANGVAGTEPVVAFWNSIARNARVYRAAAGGRPLTFQVVDGERRDVETGSLWNFAGRAVAGPLDGQELEPHPAAYHAFWFAWSEFHPDTRIWSETMPPNLRMAQELDREPYVWNGLAVMR